MKPIFPKMSTRKEITSEREDGSFIIEFFHIRGKSGREHEQPVEPEACLIDGSRAGFWRACLGVF